MTEQSAIDALNAALREKFHSLAGYVLKARPYAVAADQPILDALASIAAEDENQARELAQLIEDLDGVPNVGLSDPIVAEIAYLRAPFLARKCLEQKRGALAKFIAIAEEFDTKGAAEATTCARPLLRRLIETERRHVAMLQSVIPPESCR